ncbi:Mov34/MPN/PAD-1 family protein [Besnoitia besnoiti]|uniref:COP9 signalosome complex subunit 5 n=1 Tax=Besnoitia besnoiti TaxID=94643 RepID=A0A2A9MF05_BESBE|nr:Mov34/MPN/PAD-1 family protein [Besnoitia besnoiti]PFH33950.1 Mov34/MPN/PAD-1 family protein [Besnoitia besnoiti]
MEAAAATSAASSWATLSPALSPEDFSLAHAPSDAEQQALHALLPRLAPRALGAVRLSPLALLQMLLHADGGAPFEVMGLMLGSMQPGDSAVARPEGASDGQAFVIHSVFRLPVEGTETRVNAGAEANEYMVSFVCRAEEAREANLCVVGWYHSHPGYRCWLSGIDVETQKLHQRGQEPFLAIVVDPTRTLATGEVDIGAFRCYPDGCSPDSASPGDCAVRASVPLEKGDDFGVHWRQYYKLQLDLLCSSLDALLIRRLAQASWFTPLLPAPQSQSAATRRAYRTAQMLDVASKSRRAEATLFPPLPKVRASASASPEGACARPSAAVQAPKGPPGGPLGASSAASSLAAAPPNDARADRIAALADEEEAQQRMQRQTRLMLESSLRKKHAARLLAGERAGEPREELSFDAVVREAKQLACDARHACVSAAVSDLIFSPADESCSWIALRQRLREKRRSAPDAS